MAPLETPKESPLCAQPDGGVRNPFRHDGVACLYAGARPDFHRTVVERIAACMGDDLPADYAVDVGCGTGLSTRALASIARQVLGVDVAPEMLRHARGGPRVRYLVARAECLPLAAGSIGLMTVASAFHWFDQSAFLDEVSRVLKPGGWIVNYDDYFLATMRQAPEFGEWYRRVFLAHCPAPPRGRAFAAIADAARGLTLRSRDEYRHVVAMTRDELCAYLLTQSGSIAAMHRGREASSLRGWLHDELGAFFRSDAADGATGHFDFGGVVCCLTRDAPGRVL